MDRLETELREVLAHDRRALSGDLVSLDAVYAGAARRRRRRTAAVSAAGALVLAAVAVPVSLMLADDGHERSSITTLGGAGLTPQAPADTTPTPTSSAPSTEHPTARSGPAWDGASVLSVTATSTRTFIVLGVARDCATTTCLRLARSTDGGRAFSPLAVPNKVAVNDTATSTVVSVRFGSASDGWLFGDGLWSTHDGGASWTRNRMPGRVLHLEPAAGTAWALVSDGPRSPVTNLWRTPLGSDDWTRVADVSLSYGADLIVQSQHVVVLDASSSTGWVGDRGKFSKVDNPCAGSLGAALSAAGSVWASCVTGTSARLLTSPDGTGWKPVAPSFLPDALPNQAVVGARSEGNALLALGPDEPFYLLRADGSGAPVKQPPTTRGATSYIGFTTRDVGYAITAKLLWRTDDGGDTWTLMHIG